jgi:predicted solute-binding protein
LPRSRVLFRERFSIEPRWTSRSLQSEPSVVLERGESDAVVVIGNLALAMSGRFAHEYDLGQEWWRLTRLPFVFAVWAVRPGVTVGDLPEVLRQSLRLGLAHLDLIAKEAARTLALDPELCSNYLRAMIRYELNERAWQGMARFFELCVGMAMCPPYPPVGLAQWVKTNR